MKNNEFEILKEVNDKSPFKKDNKIYLCQCNREINYKNETLNVISKFYYEPDMEMKYTTSELDEENIWEIIKEYCKRKNISPFDLINKYEQL